MLLVPVSFLISLNLAHEVLAFSFPEFCYLGTHLLFEKSANLIEDINAINAKIDKQTQWIRPRQLTTHIKQQEQ